MIEGPMDWYMSLAWRLGEVISHLRVEMVVLSLMETEHHPSLHSVGGGLEEQKSAK